MARISPVTDQADKLRKIVKGLREKSGLIIDRAAKNKEMPALLLLPAEREGWQNKHCR